MNVSPNVNLDRIEEADFKLQFQYPKCLNEKSQESQSDYLVDELAGYLNSASASDMCALSVNPEKCAIFQETVNKICQIKLEECGSSDDLQKSEVSSSKPSLFGNDLVGPILLQALDGFLFMVNTDGKIEFVSTNVKKFLKYSQDSLIDKSIYNIIHVGDHARFSSNLLPMSIGNGFSWSEPNTSVSKSRSFNCRFLVRPPDDQEETMEEKQTRISQYEEMQISAVLLPFSGERTEADDLDTDIQNHLVCVARRVPSNEKNSAPPLVHFSTRLDLQGKITSIDNSAVPATYSQYLNKDFVGQNILELCHPDDVQKVTHHLKETLQQGSNTSGIYRLKFHQKIIQIQTKSKRYSMASEQEIIIANHTVLRDSDRCLENNVVVRNNPSPASGSLAPSVGSNMNGNSYSFSAMSPEFLSDMASLDFLPTSSWDLGGGEEQNIGDGANLPTSLGGPATPASAGGLNSGAQQRTQHPSGSAFSPELLSGRGSPSTRSPAQLSATGSPAPGRVTPFQNTFPFSPVSSQTVSRTSSPAPNLIKREDTSLPSGNVELSNLSPMSGLMGDCQNSTNSSTQKLRNLLTHGIEEADSSVPKTSNDKIDENENGFSSRNNSDMVCSRNENIILRELLNQEDEEMRDESAKTLPCDSNCNVNLSSELCSNDSGQKRTVNNNNMLRKLLNNDENIKKTQDNLIQELLKTEGKVSGDNNSQPKVLSNYDNSVMKRKSPDTPTEDSLAKRQSQSNPQHAHLAGQNPMLASMLAQTPRTTPTVPTSVANAIVSQLPQERLPKNLEKKLVHTPYTGANTSGTSSVSNTQYSFTNVQMGARSLLSSHLQQEVVTADSRGHVTLAPQNNNFPPNNYLGKMLPNNFLGKIPSDAGSTDLNLQNHFQNQYLSNSQSNLQPSTNQLLFDGLTDNNTDPNNAASSSDPLLSVILDQVYSMEEDLKMEPDLKMATSPDDMLKFLDDIPDSVTSASPQPISRDVNEKMAINAIQRQLMSFEVPGSSQIPRNNLRFQQPVTMPMMPQNPVVSYSQANQYQTGAPPAYTLSNQRTRAPGIHGVQNNINMVPSAPQINNRQVLPQYGGVQTINDLSPQMKRHYIEQRQKLFVQQQQQKRLLMQQKQQQLTLNTRQAIPDNMPNLQSPATAPFPEGMNDLLNNTVAPNVTLQRSTSLPEPQLSPRYSNVQQIPNQAAPPPSPSQLSPGQRQQPPFSPMSQQGYPNNYPQSRLSPHMPSQPVSNQAWVQRAPQNPANLQQQNPMLNAQLSQQASYGGQPRFPNQQPPQSRQIVVRSMPSPGSRNSPYSNPPDSPFHPPSPGVALYQQQNQALPQQPAQAPQQRLQRAVSIPNRVNSPRGLPAGYTGNDPILSPQPSPSNFNPPVSTYNPPMPVSTSSSFNTDNFSYDQQVYPGAMVDRNRGNGGNTMTEYVRQELRAMVGARTQQHQAHQQQMVQQMPQNPGSQSSNQSLSQADIDALGFSLDFGNEGQPSSPALFSQSLLGVAGGNENQSRTSSPRFVMEEQRPTEQKKSLLQQLLSEPP